MKKKLSLIVAILVLLAMVIPVYADTTTTTGAPGTWLSSINIQNTGTGAADVVIIYNDAAGAVAFTDSTSITGVNAIPAGGSRTIVMSTVAGLPSGQYSVVMSSSQPLEVVANSSSKAPVTAGAYSGIKSEQLATTLFFPGLYKGYYGFSSEIVLQNSEATTANITIQFYNPATGAEITAAKITSTIPANATKIFGLANFATIPSGNTNGILSAKVTSDKLLAGIANVWTAAFYGEFGDYDGVSNGATTIYAPSLLKNYYGFVSSFTIQNIGNFATNIKVTYSNGSIENATLAPFQSIMYFQPANASLPSGNTSGVFSAKVESIGTGGNPAQPIVGLVNAEDKTKGSLASSNAADTSGAKIGCPIVMKSYYGWFSATTVQNVGTQTTDVTVTYASGQTKVFPGIIANGTVNVIEIGSGTTLPGNSSVSATYSSSNGQPLVAVVQENSDRYPTAPGDYLLAYTCVPQP
jgi:hypothetical protein